MKSNAKSKGQAFNGADIYCITSSEHSNGRSNAYVVSKMIESGIKIIQYREKNKTMAEKLSECLEIRKLTKACGVTFIVNDHIDIAIMADADGVHIGQDDIPVSYVRKLLGPDKIIGVSTHSPEQAEKAISDGADYIGVGPIFRTFTKTDVCDPVGLEYLDYVVNSTDIPFVAIGGIKIHNMASVIKRGARCICLVTEIVGADDILGTIEKAREIFKNGGEPK